MYFDKLPFFLKKKQRTLKICIFWQDTYHKCVIRDKKAGIIYGFDVSSLVSRRAWSQFFSVLFLLYKKNSEHFRSIHKYLHGQSILK